ncbi:hypothetical protein PSU4_10720 [Pseudonocardia sulfidoxydans NBRC 16205]|uniref:Uncharacterized protein n=1 Tax=Pseudonocardia sulfidoxydans NBRC 16205 TaxID=1223511 RepID=A0A511DGI7_9PSEU|nr:hypothetical protein PSU4_10720 [Pseudonocardia sulfidoxydans NBRC 16205]
MGDGDPHAAEVSGLDADACDGEVSGLAPGGPGGAGEEREHQHEGDDAGVADDEEREWVGVGCGEPGDDEPGRPDEDEQVRCRPDGE